MMKANDQARIATAVVLIPLVLLLVLKAPLYVLAVVAGAVALLAIAEFLKLNALWRPATDPFDVYLRRVLLCICDSSLPPIGLR
jgi:CDP-diglyceride synthetase